MQEGIEEGEDAAERVGSRHPRRSADHRDAPHRPLAARSPKLAVDWRGRGAVGFDIAGPEDGFLPSRHTAAFDYLAVGVLPRDRARRRGGRARLDPLGADRRARTAPRPRRAHRRGPRGHLAARATRCWCSSAISRAGCATARSRSSCRRRRTCRPARSTHGAQTLADHPFDLLYQLGFAVTVNVDNRTMSRTSLTRELAPAGRGVRVRPRRPRDLPVQRGRRRVPPGRGARGAHRADRRGLRAVARRAAVPSRAGVRQKAGACPEEGRRRRRRPHSSGHARAVRRIGALGRLHGCRGLLPSGTSGFCLRRLSPARGADESPMLEWTHGTRPPERCVHRGRGRRTRYLPGPDARPSFLGAVLRRARGGRGS